MAKNQPMTPPAGDEIFLLKMGEMVLKGLNRRTFEERLMGNARRRLEKFGKFRIYSRQSITYIEPKTEDCDMDGAFETLTRLFGVVGLSRAKACEKTPEAILETAKTYLHDDLMAARRFKVESKRSDKSFPLTSIQLSQFVGGELNEAFPHIVADMHTPDLIVHVEVRDFAAYVHANPTPGAGGLPVGVGGHAVSLLSGGIDSPVASWMMAKRGLALEMVHFFSYPYTSPEAKEKVPGPGPAADPLVRAADGPCRPLHGNSGGAAPQLPGGPLHPAHAPLYDAHLRAGGQARRRPWPGHRRIPGPGGQPDHGGHGRHRSGLHPARLPARYWHGQRRDHPHRPEDRDL